ncbi:MAG: hypothetical protein HGB10_09700 [Coriobacteriia bacterium]|nr:hypothetical protein [Coriobacteriia bacterium]
MRSVHDNRVIGFEVDGRARRIVLHTVYEEAATVESTDVVFEGILAYHLAGDNLEANILLDVEEWAVEELLGEQAGLFEAGRKHGWPGVWNTSDEALRSRIVESGARAFRISPSFGLDGWVLAASCEFIAVEALVDQ